MKYDLSVYDKHLSSHKLVREHEIPYMNGWVRHYLLLGKPIEVNFANILAEEGRTGRSGKLSFALLIGSYCYELQLCSKKYLDSYCVPLPNCTEFRYSAPYLYVSQSFTGTVYQFLVQ